MNKKRLNISVVFLGPFPIGNVSTVRIISYCKAFVKKGHFVKVFIIAPTDEAKQNKLKCGVVDGVHFQYVSRITWRGEKTNFIVKILYYLWGIFKLPFLLYKIKNDVIITYHSEIFFNIIVKLYCLVFYIPLVLDKTEYPKNFFNRNRLFKIYEKTKLIFFDKIITISKELEEFYSNIIPLKNVFLLPATVDIERYNIIKLNQNITNKYIGVMFGTHNRDNILDSIYAYKQFLDFKIEKPWDLYLIGDFETLVKKHPENLKIIDYIEKENLSKRIKFLGLISNEKIPELIVNAQCLMTTPRRFISGGFPTKLAEYLLSGKPVIATNVGEISEYLTHNKNVLFAPKGNINELAKCLLFVYKNKSDSLIIGQNGQNVAKKKFNADNYIEDLIIFFKKT